MTEKRPNIREVAKVAGVSVASVSRALKQAPSPYLSSQQREHILQICEKMRYVPNAHTLRMFSNQANTVAILFPTSEMVSSDRGRHLMDPNLGSCLCGAQSILAEKGVGLLLTEMTPKFIGERQYLTMWRSKSIDGVFIWGALDSDDFIDEILNEKIPTVMLQTAPEHLKCSKVVADDYAGMRSVTTRLLQCGHRKFALALPPLLSSTGRNRCRGILDTLVAAGVKSVYEVGSRGYGYCFGLEAGKEILEQSAGATAVIASNDSAAWGCIDTFRKAGLAVPSDVSVTGADGLLTPGTLEMSSFFSPSYDIGRHGAELLLSQIADGAAPGELCLPVAPIAGNTIATPKGSSHE